MAVFFFLLFNFLFLVPFDANTRWKPFLLTLSHTYLALVVALSVSRCPFARKADFCSSRPKLAKPGKPRGFREKQSRTQQEARLLLIC